MGRVYATDDKGERFLRYIECDGCGKKLVPGSSEREMWRKHGWDNGPGTQKYETYKCPECE